MIVIDADINVKTSKFIRPSPTRQVAIHVHGRRSILLKTLSTRLNVQYYNMSDTLHYYMVSISQNVGALLFGQSLFSAICLHPLAGYIDDRYKIQI